MSSQLTGRMLAGAVLPAALLLSLATLAPAQTLPTPAQAQQMLQADPSLIGRLQQMMQQSGLTADQVRARLRSQGYPDSLLDAYLPGGTPNTSTLPGDDTFAAIRALGLADSVELDSLLVRTRGKRITTQQADSLFLDSLKVALTNDSTREAMRTLLRSSSALRQQIDSGLMIFGSDLFKAQNQPVELASATGGADPNYRFGPGDQLVLFLTGDVEKSYQLSVTREGFVVIPDVGQLNVVGLTRSQLDDALYTRLGRVYSGVRRNGGTTRFYVDVAQMGTNQVFVNGDVVTPGSYRVSRAATVLSALYLAGGPSDNGSMRNIQVRRGGQTVATLDFYAYALKGDATDDIRLENNDVVFVAPRGPQVRVAGLVIRPATYEIKPGQSLQDVIGMAGGFAETADRRRVQVEHVVPPADRTAPGRDRRVVDVPSELLADVRAQGGDVVRVPEISTHVANRVNVLGNVWAPGAVGFRPGMKVSEALHRAGGLKPDSYLGQIQITRLRPDSTRDMLRTALVDTTGRAVDDLELQDADEITVFSSTDFRPVRFVSVSGAVREPRQIPFREGMTMRDAVMLAGGLTEGALLTEAEIARLPANRAAGVTAVTEKVALDSSYLFERGPNGRIVGPPGVQATSRAPDVLLQPYDAVLIKMQPDWQLQQNVSVEGEVRYPGTYALVTKTERLSDVLNRAGGLSGAAYPEGIVFIRHRNSVGRIGIDLPQVLRNNAYIDNLQLVDGDSIYIPRFSPVVVVRGAVNSQVGVAYVRGADIGHYIRSAGGASIKGDSRHAYVTQPSGKVETRTRHFFGVFRSDPKPQAGATVSVPEKDPNDKHDWLAFATAMTSILGSLVAIAAIVRR